MNPVYILIRTSRRPVFFARMMETIQQQTYKNIVTIVHSDCPLDRDYVAGDIVIRDKAFGPEFGSGAYNLYNNRLLKAMPEGPGWYHFMDDDDEYAGADSIERMVAQGKRDHINVFRVKRWGGKVFPEKWGVQKSFQTECFFLHTDHKAVAQWWGNLGGDHDYSKKIARVLPTNWCDGPIIVQAQEGKGHGRRTDAGGVRRIGDDGYKTTEMIPVLALCPSKRGEVRRDWLKQGQVKNLPYALALELEREGKVKITYPGRTGETTPPRNLFSR
jgi:hypothetical protein